MSSKDTQTAPQSLLGEYSWADAWVETFEQSPSFADEVLRAGVRLQRNTPITNLEVAPGLISASVDHRGATYTAQIGVAILDVATWREFAERLACLPAAAVALLVGELPSELANSQSFTASLLPAAHELYPDCNCGDWHDLCGHAAALLYKVGGLIEADPFVLTTLRGQGRHEFKTMLESCRSSSDPMSPRAAGQPRGADQGVSAADAYRRTPAQLPNPRRLPLGVSKPLPVTVPPPVDSGIQSDDIVALVEAASARARRLLYQEDRSANLSD